MRKRIIFLSIAFAGCIIGAGATMGQIVKNEFKTYERVVSKPLQVESLGSLYVQSDVPVKISFTDGEPYVEYVSSFYGSLIEEIDVSLAVNAFQNETRIGFSQSGVDFGIKVNDEDSYLTVYIPKQEMDTLSIKTNPSSSYYADCGIELDDVVVKNLYLDASTLWHSHIDISGEFEDIKINTRGATANINSKTPAKVQVSDINTLNLSGNYTDIQVSGVGNLLVDSTFKAQVDIQSTNNISLKGEYEDIRIDGSQTISLEAAGNPNLTVDGSSNVTLTGGYSDISLKHIHDGIEADLLVSSGLEILESSMYSTSIRGDIPNIVIGSVSGTIQLEPANIPKSLVVKNSEGNYSEADVTVVIPKDDPSGFTAIFPSNTDVSITSNLIEKEYIEPRENKRVLIYGDGVNRFEFGSFAGNVYMN